MLTIESLTVFITIKKFHVPGFICKKNKQTGACSGWRSDLQSAVYLQVELFELLVRKRGAVGAEELLHLKTSQTAVTASLS